MDLGQALGAARRHWILPLVLVSVGLGSGAAAQLLTPPTYRSTSTVFFSLERGGTISQLADGNTYVQHLVPSYTKVATTPIVLSPVISQLGLRLTPAQLADKVSVSVQPLGQVAQINAEDSDPVAAAAIANGVADRLKDALIWLSPQSSKQTAVVTVTVLSHATPAGAPISPNWKRNLGLGMILGLIAGVAAVAVLESIFPRPLSSRTDIEGVTDLSVLGSIVADPRANSRPLPVSSHPNSARSDSFRILQTGLDGLRADGPLCFAVVSAIAGEGRSTTAANLAIAISHASSRVLLVDANLRKPMIGRLLGIESQHGLTSLLSGSSTLDQNIQTWVTQPWGNVHIDVITSGGGVPNSSELLSSGAMTWLLHTVRNKYDTVILDTPPLLQFTDGALMAAQLDGALVIVDGTRTRPRHLVEALARLRMAGADVLGIVLNRGTAANQPYASSQPIPGRAMWTGAEAAYSSVEWTATPDSGTDQAAEASVPPKPEEPPTVQQPLLKPPSAKLTASQQTSGEKPAAGQAPDS
jgi:polysaccharide biosynthesis transport protein